jgi:tRNA(Ile)-lysidine synthase
VLIACSGGPDSVALAALAARCRALAGREVRLAHIDHTIRRSSRQDALVTAAVANMLGIPLTEVVIEAVSDDEAALRERRYEALERIARECGAATIATAHHARDQAETVLLALFRGTGLDGLRGIAPMRSLRAGLMLARPLLRESPDDLRRYATSLRLPYASDPTNEAVRYRRNRLRGLLAELRADFPHLDEAVARCASIVRAESEGRARAGLRRDLRERLRRECGLRDVSFERLDALAARIECPGKRRIRIARGVEALIDT